MQPAEQHIGRYHILRLISGGGMGRVYLAEDTLIDRHVAIKVIREELGPSGSPTTQDATRLFLREAKAIARLNHPHILPMFDFGEDVQESSRRIYMVMPYCEDGSLQEWLQEHEENLPTPQEVVSMVEQAADALQYAHDQHIIHQDVKPHNFLIRKKRQVSVPDLLLSDFGIAKVTAMVPDMSYAIRGTPAYMAPEQWQGHPVPATDQYGLAATTYQLLTGHQLFQGNQGSVMYQHMMVQPVAPSSLNTQLTSEVDAVLLRALAKKPEERYPSVTAFAQALKEAVQQLASDATRSPIVGRTLEESSTLNVTAPSIQYGPHTPIPQIPVYTPAYNPPSHPGYAPTPAQFAANQQTHPDQWYAANAGHTPPALLPPPSQQPRKTPVGIIILIVILTLLLIGASTFLATSIINHNKNVNAQAGTATTRANGLTSTAHSATSTSQATATARAALNPAQITATAVARGTATAQASATAAVHNPYAPNNGTLLLSDPLQNGSQGWQEYTNNESACRFASDGFHIIETVTGYFTNCTGQPDLSNFTYEVQMTITRGDCGGIMFRMDTIHQKFYYFRICQDGGYAFYRFVDNTTTDAQKLAGAQSATINTGYNQQNTLAIVASGGTMTIYINHQSLGSVQDTAYSHGLIALVAGDLQNATEVVFKNLRIWQ